MPLPYPLKTESLEIEIREIDWEIELEEMCSSGV